MSDSRYFQDELAYLRALGAEYAKDHPELGRILSEPGSDPDFERLLEGFAFLTSRLRSKLDDALPEITHPLLQRLWPNFLRPIPALAMVEYTPIDSAFDERKIIPRGTTIRVRPGRGEICDFQTTSDCALYPLRIVRSRIGGTINRSHLKIDFATLDDLPLGQIGLDDLRLWLTGSAAETLYQWSCHSLNGLDLVDELGTTAILPMSLLSPGGFSPSDSLLPDSDPLYDGHRYLQEYFSFPQKFLCLDLSGLRSHITRLSGTTFTLELHYSRAMPTDIGFSDDSIRLFRTPAVNLFSSPVELVSIPKNNTSFRLHPPDGAAIFSVDRVARWQAASDRGANAVLEDYPCYDMHNTLAHHDGIFFRENVSPLSSGVGYEHVLSFLSRNGVPRQPDKKVEVSVRCFHSRLDSNVAPGVSCLQTQDGKPFAHPEIVSVPSEPLYPRKGHDDWALISNLHFNSQILQNRDAFRSILRLYDYRAASDRQAAHALQERLDGILAIHTDHADRILRGRVSRGAHMLLVVKESAFGGEGGVCLFLSVLAEFLRFSASTASFHHLEAQGQESGQTWNLKPRSGRVALL